MKLLTPEIAWHETLPVYSCDIQAVKSDTDEWTRLATSGGDKYIRLWKLSLVDAPSESADGDLDFLSSLDRHDKPINVVRWSPSGNVLASGSDDSLIILWKKNEAQHSIPAEKNIFADDEDQKNKETWNAFKVLRRHLEDVYDLCWSADEKHLVSGSVDQCMIQWKLGSDQALIVKDHRQYVQGVAWDPLNKYAVSLGSDRSCRVYRIGSRNCSYNVVKAGKRRLFQDDSWKSFFRRLEFSPDGHLLICPSGCLEAGEQSTNNGGTSITQQAAHIFHRSNLSRPVASLPTNKRPVIAVRFSPVRYQLLSTGKPLFGLPYRWVFVLVLEDGLLFFDTECLYPFAQVYIELLSLIADDISVQISSVHYQTLNDATWSHNGRILITCSTDGYCSVVHFEDAELGLPYKPTTLEPFIPIPVTPLSQKSTPARKDTKTEVPAVKPPNEHQRAPIFPATVKSPSPANMTTPPSKPGKRRVPLITLDSSPAPLTTEAPVFGSPIVVKPVQLVLTRIDENLVSKGTSSPALVNITPQEKSEQDIKKRRVSFTTLSPEVRLFSKEETALNVSVNQDVDTS